MIASKVPSSSFLASRRAHGCFGRKNCVFFPVDIRPHRYRLKVRFRVCIMDREWLGEVFDLNMCLCDQKSHVRISKSYRQDYSMYTTPSAPKLAIMSSQFDDDTFVESWGLKSILVTAERGMVAADALSIALSPLYRICRWAWRFE